MARDMESMAAFRGGDCGCFLIDEDLPVLSEAVGPDDEDLTLMAGRGCTGLMRTSFMVTGKARRREERDSVGLERASRKTKAGGRKAALLPSVSHHSLAAYRRSGLLTCALGRLFGAGRSEHARVGVLSRRRAAWCALELGEVTEEEPTVEEGTQIDGVGLRCGWRKEGQTGRRCRQGVQDVSVMQF